MSTFIDAFQSGFHRSVLKSVSLDTIPLDSLAWSPDQLSDVLQRLDSLAYDANLIAGLPVLDSLIGTPATPRGQRCVLFDGVNDFATRGARLTTGAVTQLTACAWVKTTVSGRQHVICGEYSNLTGQREWLLYFDTNGKARILVSVDGTTLAFRDSNLSINDGAFHHVAGVFNGSQLNIYIDGVLDNGPLTGTVPASIFNGTQAFEVGRIENDLFFGGHMRDCRVYNVAKSASEIAAIANQHLTPTTLDRTGLLAGWWLNEESGTVHYDWSGNGRNLTATNVTQATYHATDAGVRYNAANELGYTLSGAVVIPRNEAIPTQDASGGSLQFSGPIKLSATMEVPCVTFSGSDYAVGPLNRQSGELTLACWFRPDSASGTQTLFSNIGDAGGSSLDYQLEFNRTAGRIGLLRNTSVVPGVQSASSLITGVWYHIAGVISGTAGNWTLQLYINGVLDATATVNSNASGNASSAITLGRAGAFNGAFLIGRMSAACLYSVAKNASEIQAIMRGAVDLNGAVGIWPIQAGPGSSSMNRTIHDASGNGNHLTVVNGTVATQWANRTNVVRDWCLEYGGSIAANGAFVPGRIGSSLDAAGNAKGIAAGTHGNPYSRFVPNNWSAPSLVNIGSTASDAYAPSDMAGVQAESVADTRFASQRRYLAVRSALTSSNKANAEAWVA